MSNKFVVGDVLLFLKDDRAQIVILDVITKSSFIMITFENSLFEYGYEAPIKVLTPKYFKKIGHLEGRINNKWEYFQHPFKMFESD